ncbi:MAG: amidohydrolase family protein, partial [Planctomycetota bacterium]
RIAMLLVYYGAPGLAGEEWSAGQLRFRTELPAYWDQLDSLAAELDPATQSLGVVAHSIRAVGLEDLAALHEGARARGFVFHMHVEEQKKEIADCRARHGRTPMGVLLSELALDDRFTAVHCTHTDPEGMAAFVDAGANVCICPLTEANLGDGIADVPGIRGDGGSICLGSDSNARISMLEEARWLEYVQRVSREERGVCLDESGELGPELMTIATKNGARSLGLAAGAIETDALADLVAIDLDAPSLAGADNALANALMLGARDDVVAEVCVGGRWL